MNALEKFEQEQRNKLTEGIEIPDFQAGDTVRVHVRIVEGGKERIQAFQGVCLARKHRGLNSSFTVRKISHGEGVERVFPLHSPRIDHIELVRRGVVRRAKLYYMRELSGKAARIKERRDVFSKKDIAAAAEPSKAAEAREIEKAEQAKKEAAKAEQPAAESKE